MGGRGRQVRRTRRDGHRWPELRPVEGIALALVALGAMVAGIEVGDPLLRSLLDLACSPVHCQPVVLAVAGWAVIGGSMVLIGLLYRRLPPSRPAVWALAACLVLLCFGLAVMLSAGDAAAARPPHAGMLWAGLGAGLLPLFVVPPHRPVERTGPRRRTRDTPHPGRPLLLVNIGQGGTLAAVLIWAALLG